MASVAAADLVLYHAAVQSDQDNVVVGGAIDTLRRPDFTQLVASVALEVVSSAGGDTTQTMTVVGRDAQGRQVSQTVTLNGVTAVQLAALGVVERVLSAELSATCTGTVTLRATGAGATVRLIPAGERGFSMPFRKLASLVGGAVTYYAKCFWKNTNATNALLAAQVTENADPSNVFTHGLAAAQSDAGTAANRQTAPAGVVFDGAAKNVPGGDLAVGAGIGVWLAMTLGQAAAALKTSYTSGISGQTT